MTVIYKHLKHSKSNYIIREVSEYGEVLVLELSTGILKNVHYSDLRAVGMVDRAIEIQEYIS